MHKKIVIPLLTQCGLFIHTCVSINSIVPKDLIFYFLWYNVIRWSSHFCKKSSFLSFYSFLVWQSWKMPLCKWYTFWMPPCLNSYFIVILSYIERKWLLMRNLATMLPLKSKSYLVQILVQKFPYRVIQRFTGICIQIASRMQFLCVNKWCSANVFSDTKQKYVFWKVWKVRSRSILLAISSELNFVK